MRLRQIKLSGFKSFVDPTTIEFPGDLIGVVGPNGCGKSNVIDAVRWVMGEISAKHLRGDTMADVVFTGSNSRRPVAQATVDLLFDNGDGRLGGRFAGFGEVSIRRQVTREAQSGYFINGVRSRRRDVMDVFLGTGLGPRSYAIIEQGMISRLIEAKPDDLREFLEEAAGISKYKERRRETETRMRHTRDNLERLTDLREELGKRLTHLKRQATLAERYKSYRHEERELRSELLALRWRDLDREVARHQSKVHAQETVLDGALAVQRRVEADLERARTEHAGASEAFNEAYRQVLDIGAEIARGEELIQGLCQRREQLGEALDRAERTLVDAREHIDGEARRLEDLRRELAEQCPALERAEREAADAQLDLKRSEEAFHAWQAEWEALTERAAEPAQTVHTEQARIQHLEQNRQSIAERLERLQTQARSLEILPLESQVTQHRSAISDLSVEIESMEAGLDSARARVRDTRADNAQHGEWLHGARERYQVLGGRLTSLQALRQEALGRESKPATAWLESRELADHPRLAERMRVTPGWEAALELVLGARLEAICIDGLGRHLTALTDLREGALMLVEDTTPMASLAAGGRPAPTGSLRVQVVGPAALDSLLAGVLTADSLDEAVGRRGGLAAGQSIITADAVWLGPDWVRLSREPGEAGVLRRERVIEEVARDYADAEREVDALAQRLEAGEETLREAEDGLSDAQATLSQAHQRLANMRSDLGAGEATLEQTRVRSRSVSVEIIDLRAQLSAHQRLLDEAEGRLARTSAEMHRLTGEREAWSRRRDQHRQRFEGAREQWQTLREQVYEIGVQVESIRAQASSLVQAEERNRTQILDLEAAGRDQRLTLDGLSVPLREARARLSALLSQRTGLEDGLKQARGQVEAADAQVRELDQARQGHEQDAARERNLLEQIRITGQEILVRRKTVEEQLSEHGTGAEDLLRTLTEDAGIERWEEKLASVERRITRLGPINLAAIDEHEQLSERKAYLDSQQQDLEEALETLGAAIRKIDRETRARFKETYEKVNAGLGAIFPRLFGGGHATLELTGNDLLSTGVSVMARPPGKRNASIHLLSGGEKALAAIALVFAIFELNPAPFCLLDEVDAPLDDANVVRFCELVREMSERVQFVLVTHNKITMEIAQQLIGVTMNEPGVSRLVAVDLDQAVELAAE